MVFYNRKSDGIAALRCAALRCWRQFYEIEYQIISSKFTIHHPLIFRSAAPETW
jgi:hypothetical protein